MKAFLFDVDDTLYDQARPFEQAFHHLFGNETQADIEKLFITSRKYSDEVFEASSKGLISMNDMYIYRITEALKEAGMEIDGEQALEFQRYYETYQKEIALTGLMKKILDRCAGNARLGVITNGPEEHQQDKIRTLGITRWIPEDNIFISGSLDLAKPDRRIFDFAAASMDLEENETYYIGDSFENDVTGALNSGWKSIWLNRRHRKCTGSARPDYIISTEEEMYRLLAGLCGIIF